MSLAHEYSHVVEPTARSATQWAVNEMNAWDFSRNTYDALTGSAKAGARRDFESDFAAMAPGSPDRQMNFARFVMQAMVDYGVRWIDTAAVIR